MNPSADDKFKKAMTQKPNPLSKFLRHRKSILENEVKNLDIANEVGLPIEYLNEMWEVWNEEKPVRSFVVFVKNEIDGAKASENELKEILELSKEERMNALEQDKTRSLHRALGCLSTKDALRALNKRSKIGQINSRLSFS
tara:strand:+ start:4150 stop:4572 length:423 start_codon:yes stop_codon:yes gene_type:complete